MNQWRNELWKNQLNNKASPKQPVLADVIQWKIEPELLPNHFAMSDNII